MKKISIKNELGILPWVAIIVGIFILSGAAAVVYYVQSNQAEIGADVEQVSDEVATQAQEDGYPSMWLEAGLPEYPGGAITKTRQGNNLSDGVSVTVETNDSPATVKTFFDSEMVPRGFTIQDMPSNELVSYVIYMSDTKQLSIQAVKIEDTGLTDIKMSYHE